MHTSLSLEFTLDLFSYHFSPSCDLKIIKIICPISTIKGILEGDIRRHNSVRICLNRWRIISLDEKEKAQSWEIEARPTAGGHLETQGHGEAAETAEWDCSDQKPQSVVVSVWGSTSNQMGRGGQWDLRS